MNPGTIISGVAHLGLVVWVLFGGAFAREPLPAPEVADVTVLSEEEFAALTAQPTSEAPEVAAPLVAEESPTPGTPDAAVEAAPPAPAAEMPPEVAPPPAATEAPAAPAAVPEPPPSAEAEVADTPPEVSAPPPADILPPAPRDVPRPSPRVASEAAPPPPPEAETAPELVEAPAPEPSPEAVPVEDDTPAAPEEAATEIVTEAEEPAAQLQATAPTETRRPPARPARPVEQARAEPEPEPAPTAPTAPQTPAESSSASSDNVQDAVEETIAGLEQLVEQQQQPGVATGPPLTGAEKEAFRLAVRQCWRVDAGSEAANVTVSILFRMTPNARVVSESLRQTAASGGSDAAIRTAYENGRRAILRCQNENGGYDLPREKYGQWQEVEVTFNPEGMRLR